MLMVLGTVKSYRKSQALRRIKSVRTGVAPPRYCTLIPLSYLWADPVFQLLTTPPKAKVAAKNAVL